jgi:hypothetical protein
MRRAVRFFGRDTAAADAAAQRLSAEANLIIDKTRTNTKAWRNLVDQVGADEAVEHVEVGVLMGQIDSAAEVVRELMQVWREGFSAAEVTLGDVTYLMNVAQPKVDVAVEVVRAKSLHLEARAVAEAGAAYYPSVLTAAEGFLTGIFEDEPVETELRLEAAAQLKMNWNEACDRWDETSGRPLLPLVGDR